MSRHAIIIGQATDHWGGGYDVRERRSCAACDVLIGWPAGHRGKGCGGPRVIVTDALAAYCDRHRHRGGVKAMIGELPIGASAIKRVRRLLGHDVYADAANWWMQHADDLQVLTTDEFARLYGCSEGAVSEARRRVLGESRQRPAGWWRGKDERALLLGPMSSAYVADALGCSVGAVRRMRSHLAKDHDNARP